MPKPYSTKLPRPVPPEFEPTFVRYGWCTVNQMFGKNPSLRYFRVLGPARLRAARNAFVRGKGVGS